MGDVGDGQGDGERDDGGRAAVDEGVPGGRLRRALVEEHERHVAQREVVEREPAPPRLGEGGLQHDHHRQEERQRGHEQAPGQQRPAPAAEPDQPALAALAGERHVAAARDDAALEPEERHRDGQQRHRVGRGHLDLRWELEELPEHRGHHLEAAGQRDERGHAEQRDGFQEGDDEGGHDRGQRERQRDAQRPAHDAGAEGGGRVVHLGGDQVERSAREDEDIRIGIGGDDEDEARHAVDVERPGAGARERHPHAVEPAGVGPGEQDPGDGAEVVGDDEGAEDGRPHEALARHIGPRHRPRHGHAEEHAQHANGEADHERIDERLDVAPPPERAQVVRQRQGATLRILERDPEQPRERIDHQHEQQGNEQQPDETRAVHALRSRRCPGTAP